MTRPNFVPTLCRAMCLALWFMPSIACDDGTPSVTPDATTDTSTDQPAECTLALTATTADVGLGGRVALDLSASDPLDAITVTVPDGYRARVDVEGSRLLVFAPYVQDATSRTVQLSAPCGASLSLTVTMREPAWTQIPTWTAGQDGPLGREYFNMWIDAGNPDRLLVFGGFHYVPQQFTTAWDMWSFDLAGGGGWTELNSVSPPQLAGGRLALIPQTQQGIHYGGISFTSGGGANVPFSLSLLDYGSDPPSWTTLTPDGAPNGGTYQPAFFYDAPRDRYLAVGGQGALGTHMDVSEFHRPSNTWLPKGVDGAERPSGRTGFFWVHDPETQRFIAFSGEQGGPSNGCDCAQDTWALELSESPMRWVKLLDAQDPLLGRRNGAYALDPEGHRMLVWGGTPDGLNSYPGMWALTLDRGNERWQEVVFPAGATPPSVRSSGGMVYDAARNRFLMGFGNDSVVGAYEDLWALEL